MYDTVSTIPFGCLGAGLFQDVVPSAIFYSWLIFYAALLFHNAAAMDIISLFKKQRVLRITLIFIVLVVIVWILALRWQQNRVVSRVSVVGTNLLRQQEILDLVKLNGTRAVRDVNTAEIERRVAKHPFVKSVSVFMSVSDALTVQIEERKPIAMLVNKGRQFYVDAEGKVLPYRLTETVLDLPLLSGFGRGAVDSVRLAMALSTMNTLQEQNSKLFRSLSEIDIHSGGEMTLHFTERPLPIRFGNDEQKEQKIARIAAFMHHVEQSHSSLKNIAFADVRWDNVVILHPAN